MYFDDYETVLPYYYAMTRRRRQGARTAGAAARTSATVTLEAWADGAKIG